MPRMCVLICQQRHVHTGKQHLRICQKSESSHLKDIPPLGPGCECVYLVIAINLSALHNSCVNILQTFSKKERPHQNRNGIPKEDVMLLGITLQRVAQGLEGRRGWRDVFFSFW